ncbi:MAG: hypothetical protein LBL08_01970 [Candidatus Nomurabacteria bacterium]|jgi:hypothetical protein|nr:hypothetical protein [Candidatus Nomurabacteria bacterium]
MSLLSKIRKIGNKIKNWSTKKKIIVGSIVFAVLAGGVTAGLIIWKNSQEVATDGVVKYIPDKVVGKDYPDESGMTVKSMDEIYHSNPLRTVGTREYKEIGNTYYRSFKISGLKNKDVENKINQEIDQAYQELEKLPTPKGADQTKVSCDGGPGFGNILSVVCNREDYNSNDYVGSVKNRNRSLNFRLATGEHLKFADVFTAGTNYGQIITEAYSFTLAKGDKTTHCVSSQNGFCGRYEPNYKVDYEEQIVKLILAFRNQKDVDFSVSPDSINFVVDGKTLSYNFKWDYKNVAIYKRFAADNEIYDNDKTVSGFVFSMAQSYVFGKVSDNLFVDCIIYDKLYSRISDKDMSEAVIRKSEEIINSAVENLKSNTNGDQFAIFTCDMTSDAGDDSYLGATGNVFRMTKSYFDKVVYNRIVDSNHSARSSMGSYTMPYYGTDNNNDSNISHSEYPFDVYFFKNGNWTQKTKAQYEKEQQQKEQAKLDEEERKQEVSSCRDMGYNTWTKNGGCSGDRRAEPYDSACKKASYGGGFMDDNNTITCWNDENGERLAYGYGDIAQIEMEYAEQ